MGKNESRNLESQRREQNGIEYFDRGTIKGRDDREYDRFAIHTHFIEVGEDQAEIVKRYVLPISQEGDVLSFGAKVMAMCTRNVYTKEQIKPGFWAKLLSPHASETVAGIGMHDPYKLQLAINMVGARQQRERAGAVRRTGKEDRHPRRPHGRQRYRSEPAWEM